MQVENDMKDYDIIVIGSGPAGCIFSKYVRGKKVLLVDGQSAAHPKPCGGLISPDAQDLLACFDFTLPQEVMANPQIFSVRVIDLESRNIRFFRRCYINTDRYQFDRYLLSLVPDTVDKISGRCVKIEDNNPGYTVYVTSGGVTEKYSAAYVVGADGASSVVRQKAYGAHSIKKYTAIQQWFRADVEQNPFYSCIFDKETSDSCSWVMFKDGFLIYGGCFEPAKCREMFEKQKSKAESLLGIRLGEPVKTEACQVCSPRGLSDFKTGEGNLFLIGEAAGFISSSSFEGISSALKSGYLLARAFDDKNIRRRYLMSVLPLRLKLFAKTFKRAVICNSCLRNFILKSGIGSIKLNY